MGVTVIRLPVVLMATTAMPPMPVRLTVITARLGLVAVSSSAPVRGSGVVMAMDTVASTAIAAGTAMDTAVGTATGAAMVMAADIAEDTAVVIVVAMAAQ